MKQVGLEALKASLQHQLYITQSDADLMPVQLKITRKKVPETDHNIHIWP